MDLEYLVGALDDDPRLTKYAALNRALVGLVDDYSHVRFQTLSITVRDARRCRRAFSVGPVCRALFAVTGQPHRLVGFCLLRLWDVCAMVSH